jgi:hypothetical protein
MLEWSYDPDPSDHEVLTHYAYVLREADGTVHHHVETHRTGLFSAREWLDALDAAGFDARLEPERTTEDRQPRAYLVGRLR